MHALLALGLGVDHGPALWILVAGDVLTFASVPSVLRRRRGRPVSALAWLLALFGLPFVGAGSWWLLARTRLERPLRHRAAALERICEACPPLASSPHSLSARLRAVAPFALSGARVREGVFPPAAVGEAELLVDGGDFFAALEAAIASARTEVRVQIYIWRDDATGRRLAEVLAAKARGGVRVHVLVDAVGTGAFRLRKRLTSAGARVASFHPLRLELGLPAFQLRNHRKLFWIDGREAFVGGMNVGQEYEREWHDLGVRFRGPVVHHLGEVFREDWAFATGTELDVLAPPHADSAGDVAVVIAGGPDRVRPRIEDTIVMACGAAKSRAWVLTPYFIPTEPVRSALRTAALRGVDVRLVVPARGDVRLVALAARPFYRELIEDGVQVLEYQDRVLHAKAILVDDDLTLLGSVNLDERSMRLNFELLVCTVSSSLAAQLEVVFEDDMLKCRALAREELLAESRWSQLAESAAHLLSPLL